MNDAIFKADRTALLAEVFLQAMLSHSREATPSKAFDMATEFIREGKRRGHIEISETIPRSQTPAE
jgi:hypothetical protein